MAPAAGARGAPTVVDQQKELEAAQRIAVPGGRTAREIAEQQKIDEFGGIGKLLNERNPIGRGRWV